MEKLSTKEIRLLVLKNTIRVLRERKLYYIFRFFVGFSRKSVYNGIDIKSTFKLRSRANKFRDDNPFYNVKGFKDIQIAMLHLERQFADCKEISKDNSKLIQKIVMGHVNNLLHYCIERGVKDISIMETLGKEIFEMSCKKILGEDFVDEMETNQNEEMIEIPHMTREGLSQMYRIMQRNQMDSDDNNMFLNSIFEDRTMRGLRFTPSFYDDDFDDIF